jgi:hypothetical protein
MFNSKLIFRRDEMAKSKIHGYRVIKPSRTDLNRYFGSFYEAQNHARAYSRSSFVGAKDSACHIMRCRYDGTEEVVEDTGAAMQRSNGQRSDNWRPYVHK